MINVVDEKRAETRLTGISIAPGLAAGKAWIPGDLLKPGVNVRRIGPNEVQRETDRIRAAVEETCRELEESARRIQEQFNAALAGIFRAHAAMLQSLLASGEFERELLDSQVGAETAVARVFRRWKEKFQSLNNDTFRQRADDLADLGRRVLRHLRGEGASPWQHVPPGSVLVLERLLPSDVVALPRHHVAGIVVESLGQGSHAALLTREKGIPTAAEFPDLFDRLQDGDELLVDGYRGTFVITPDAATRAEFHQRLEQYRATQSRCKGACHEPARTLDRELVTVEANVGAYEDVALVMDNGADGVGLFRIEQLYLARDRPPTEQELFEELRAVTRPLRDKPVTVRLLDIGGDKPLPFLRLPAEANPALGKRGVRLLRDYPPLIRTQLTALLQLSQEQEIRVLVPMVTLEEDIQVMRELFEAALTELGIAKRPAFGAMLETPAAALGVPAITRHADFLCVGTNDLTQYTLAAGRDDPTVNRYYVDDHAAIWRLLGIIAADAGRTPVTVCGELAGREEVIPRLLTIGFRALSIAPGSIPTVKELIRGLHVHPEQADAAPAVPRIEAADLKARLESGQAVTVLDARSAEAWDGGRFRIPGAVRIDDDRLPVDPSWPRDRLTVVYCTCPRDAGAAVIATHLRDRGFSKAVVLRGGLDAWQALGAPVEPR
jgi:phosphoenolpyruvate-protein phosphotransferase